jgi:hypothetical protein
VECCSTMDLRGHFNKVLIDKRIVGRFYTICATTFGFYLARSDTTLYAQFDSITLGGLRVASLALVAAREVGLALLLAAADAAGSRESHSAVLVVDCQWRQLSQHDHCQCWSQCWKSSTTTRHGRRHGLYPTGAARPASVTVPAQTTMHSTPQTTASRTRSAAAAAAAVVVVAAVTRTVQKWRYMAPTKDLDGWMLVGRSTRMLGPIIPTWNRREKRVDAGSMMHWRHWQSWRCVCVECWAASSFCH